MIINNITNKSSNSCLLIVLYYIRRTIGRSIVESIVEKAQEQKLAGCQFITVEALSSDLYNAVGFYSRCGFAPCEMPNPNKGTLRMFRTLYPLALEKDVI